MFFTIFALVRFPITSVPFLSDSVRRTSILTLEKYFSARPPGVVSGLPYITPIFSRSWFMKITIQLVFEIEPASLRSA